MSSDRKTDITKLQQSMPSMDTKDQETQPQTNLILSHSPSHSSSQASRNNVFNVKENLRKPREVVPPGSSDPL